MRELPLTLKEIKKNKALDENFIVEMKKDLKDRCKTESEIYSICNGVLMYNERVVVPLSLQKWILKEFHTGHPDISRMKSLIWSYVYWRMDRDIESWVKSYKGCALAAKAPPTKFNLWPETNHSWSCRHIDFAGPLSGSYLIVVSFSKWPEILRCKKPTTKLVIGFPHELFTRFGVPDTIVSDNGTQFISNEFKEFCKTLVVEHITITPFHLRSNGQA